MGRKARLAFIVALLALVAAVGGAYAQRPPVVEVYRGTLAFTPDHRIVVPVLTDRPQGVSGTLYLLPSDLARSTALEARAPTDAELAKLAPLRSVISAFDPFAADGRAHRIDLGILPIGRYALSLQADGVISKQTIDVTSLGTLAHWNGSHLIAFAIDLRTLRKRGDVALEALQGSQRRTARTDRDGLAQLELAPNPGAGNVRLLARATDGSLAVTSLWNSSSGSVAELGFIQLDRPIYRPGQTIFYRAILRSGEPGAFALGQGTRAVTLTSQATGATLAKDERALSEFGTVNGSLRIPDDTALGSVQLTVGGATATAAVEAYKKPEYVLDLSGAKKAIVGGTTAHYTVSAAYLFGRPAGGMTVHYRAVREPIYQWWGGPWRFSGLRIYPGTTPAETLAEGTLATDEAGRAAIEVPTKPLDAASRLVLQVDARDDSGRTVSTQASAALVPASFALSLLTPTAFVRRGDLVDYALTARDYEGKPRAGVAIDVTFSHVLYQPRLEPPAPQEEHVSVRTDDKGTAALQWRAKEPGYYSVVASALDEAGRKAVARGSLWVTSDETGPSYRFDSATLVGQKDAYAPGEHARLLVTSPAANVDALLLIANGNSLQARSVHLDTTVSTIDVVAPHDAAQYSVTLEIPTAQGYPLTANALLKVAPAPRELHVAIAPNKSKYVPGEQARFSLEVRDGANHPVRAEVGIAIVDEAIFALRQANALSPYDAFYRQAAPPPYPIPSWSNVNEPYPIYGPLRMVEEDFAGGAPRFKGAIEASIVVPAPHAQQPGLDFTDLRSDFRDTAFWAPAVVTGNDGRGDVSFAWPDSLTTYDTNAVAVTAGTDIGTGSAKSLVTKDFLIRLESPRFLRRGDRSEATVIAHGAPGATRATLRFSAPALGVADARGDVAFDAMLSATKRFDVQANGLGLALLQAAGVSGPLRDGMELRIPVEAAGAAEDSRAAGSLPNDARLDLHLPAGYEAGDLRLDLAPSLVASLIANVRLLDVYPYGCVEQTMSAALPAVFVERVLQRAKLPEPSDLKPSDISRKAIRRLTELQHPDGSWGWWEHDAANPFMTAYALYGLAEMRKSGYDAGPAIINRGVESLIAQLATSNDDTLGLWGGPQAGSQWNTRAFMLFALADAAPERVDRALLAEAASHSSALNSYAVATLGLAYRTLGDTAGAQRMLAILDARVSDDGTYASWRGESWHYRWQDDPIETTAYALRLEAALHPNSPRVARVVNWLRAKQRGAWWYTTKDTAAAVYAISEAVTLDPAEFTPHETVRIRIGDRLVKELTIRKPVLDAADAGVTIPAELLAGGGSVTIERSGTGSLYWSSDWVRYAPASQSRIADLDEAGLRDLGAPLESGFTIARTYHAAHPGPWQVGDEVTVDVEVRSASDSEYVAIEDPFPAGLEYQPLQYESGNSWSGLQFFDDRAVFFATRTYANYPLKLTYRLRVTTAGTYTAAPPTAYAMYGPPLSAAGTPERITIVR
jgi:uncharacterized protein YfaS (alpha-2-macroglobulin family)